MIFNQNKYNNPVQGQTSILAFPCFYGGLCSCLDSFTNIVDIVDKVDKPDKRLTKIG